MSQPVTWVHENDIAVITIDNPPVNALGQAVRAGLLDCATAAAADEEVKAILIVCAGRTFIAGADIKEFGKPLADPSLPHVINQIEALNKPVISAIHGTALGGGFEVALGSHYRIAHQKAKVGLPETRLGIFPGAGGTQRTPRLCGAEVALRMMGPGAPISAGQGVEHGLIDEIVEGDDMRAAGLVFCRRVIDQNMPVRRSSEETAHLGDANNTALFEQLNAEFSKKFRGEIAPQQCVRSVREGLALPFDQALANERKLFTELMDSPQREGLIHAFFTDRQVSKIPEAKSGTPRPLEHIAVIGGGTMGAGIATACLLAGLPVITMERDQAAVDAGRERVDTALEGAVKRGKMTQEHKDSLMNQSWSGSTDYSAIANVDLVIEAVFEDMDVKKAVFAELEKYCKPNAILATNTSYLDVEEIAASTSRPQDVLGLHFFSPAHVMKLLEVVVAKDSAADVVATAFALAKKLKKVAVRAGVCDGFIGNRILGSYLKCAYYMVEDGVSPYQLDRAVKAFGYPMGPFEMGDLAGLDIGWANRKRKAASLDPRERTTTFADDICEQGWYGQKTGQGFYQYEKGVRGGTERPEVLAIIEKSRAAADITPRDFSDEEIIDKYLAALINEAAKVVDEGIALRPLDVDQTSLYGYGFPRWRGGPLKYADMVGLDKVLENIESYAQEDDYFWQPAQLLKKLVAEGKNFDSLNQG